MVYCTKCGAKNEDDVDVCAKCGAPLKEFSRERRRRPRNDCFGRRERHMEDECFGLPHGGAIMGVIFGALLVILGLAITLGINVWDYLGALFLIIIGILVVAGALYGIRRRY